jgi:hypothetical protein
VAKGAKGRSWPEALQNADRPGNNNPLSQRLPLSLDIHFAPRDFLRLLELELAF